VRVVKLPWAEPSSRYTARFEVLAIEWLEEASQKAVGEQWGLSCDEIHGIMDRAVERGRERQQASLDGFLKTLSEKKKQSIEAVDRVRGWEQKTLKVAGDERLTGTRYDWLRYRVTNAAGGSINAKI